MSFKWAWVTVLVLQTWSAVLARPSEQGDAPSSPILFNKTTILNGCPSSLPHSFATPQQVAGDWCGLINGDTVTPIPPPSCHRYSFSADGDKIKLLFKIVENGQVNDTRDISFTKLENESWLSTSGGRTRNFFIGYSENERLLFLCGTITSTGQQPDAVYGIALARCLNPGDESQVASGARQNVQWCNPVA